MRSKNMTLPGVVEVYFTGLGRVRELGGKTGKRSGYGSLVNLLNAAELIY